MIEIIEPQATGPDPDDWPPPNLRDLGLGTAMEQLDCSEVLLWRERLTIGALPDDEAALMDLLRAVEDLKSASAAVQARAAIAFENARVRAEADSGVPKGKRGVGVGAEVALARRESPFRGGRLLGLARGLVQELPYTLKALASGTVNEWRATIITRETACLSAEDRAVVDAWLANYLVDHPSVGDNELTAAVRRKVIEIDQDAVVNRRAAAAGDRHVSLRPLPDGMVRFSAVLGLHEGVAIYAALKKVADQQAGSLDEHGEPRGRGAVMADELVARVTGRTAAKPSDIDLTIVITDEALLSETDEPAHIDGYGPGPASWVRRLVGGLIDPDQRVTVRRLFRKPGRLVQLESASRLMTPAMKHLIRLRDQICRTPYCGAPLRHADHVVAHEGGGPTSLTNGQGLCEACNYTKAQPGWRSTASHDPKHGHTVTITTPTGHRYTSVQPEGPL